MSSLIASLVSIPLVAALGGLVATYSFLFALLRLTQDAREPKLVSTLIPFLSPILGMVRWNMGFYNHMSEKFPNLPIYTLRLPGTRIYIVNSTSLIPVVQRQWRTLLFPPVIARASEAAMGGSREALRILRRDMVTENGFLPGFIRAIHPTLSRGASLDSLSSQAVNVLVKSLSELAAKGKTRHKLFDWTQKELLMATTESVYGPHNPKRSSHNVEAWEFHPTIMFLMLDILPHWAFRTSLRSRDHLAKSFLQYHREGRYNEGSAFIQHCREHFVGHGVPEEDIAKFHIGGMFALVANTIPTAFWTVFHILSDPSTLDTCREEASRALNEANGVCILDGHFVTHSCPTLLSVFQEVLRFHGMGTSARVADEDQMLDDRFLIKKGGLVMIPARVQHRNRDIWDPDAEQFNPKRFVEKADKKSPNPVAFRGFGGGTTLCPGRHFAANEILVFAALLIVRFDIFPVTGHWKTSTAERSSQAEAMKPPDVDPDVKFHPRFGIEKAWRVTFGGNDEAILVAEDMEKQVI